MKHTDNVTELFNLIVERLRPKSISDVSDKSGVSVPTLLAWTRNSGRRPLTKNILRVSKVVGINVRWRVTVDGKEVLYSPPDEKGCALLFQTVKKVIGKYDMYKVSEESGLSQCTVRTWLCSDIESPRIDSLLKVAETIGVEVDWEIIQNTRNT